MSDYPTATADIHTHVGPAGSHFERIAELARQAPIYWNNEAQGYWVITRNDDIVKAGTNTAVFTNESIVAVDPDPIYRMLPSNAEPPILRHLRAPVAAFLSPRRVEHHREALRAIANELLDEFASGDSIELMDTIGDHYPVRMFCHAMGMPVSDADFFLAAVRRIAGVMFEGGDPTDFVDAMNVIRDYYKNLLHRREEPLDLENDFVSMLLAAKIDGRPISDDEFLDISMTATLGSLETSKSMIGWFFWHMATHGSDREWIVRDPSIIPSALEETLRAYTIFNSARKLSQDIDFGGCPMRKGDMVQLQFTAANRDPEKFENPEKVILDRTPNDHIAFGNTAHRCLGLHLARVELQVLIEEWHKRIPDYRLAGDAPVTAHGGMITIEELHLAWDRPTAV